MTKINDISKSSKVTKKNSFASCSLWKESYPKEIPGTGIVFPKIGLIMFNPVPGASFSSKMKLLRR